MRRPEDLGETPLRRWHAIAAVGVALVDLVTFAATITTREADDTWGYNLAGLAVVALAFAVLRLLDSYASLLVWPLLVIVGLFVASLVAPEAASLSTGVLIIAFLFVGLTQPRWTSLALLPFAAATFWAVYTGPPERQLPREALAVLTWAAVAELPAWLSEGREAARREVAHLASTDPLTGLANRRMWEQRLPELLADGTVSVLLIDLDHFKRFNDEHGHLAGDDLLVEFASALRALLREGDLAARWGGEEFAVALLGASRAQAQVVGERILSAVPRSQSCSIGLATPFPNEDAASLMARVDRALYRAKEHGRSRVVAA